MAEIKIRIDYDKMIKEMSAFALLKKEQVKEAFAVAAINIDREAKKNLTGELAKYNSSRKESGYKLTGRLKSSIRILFKAGSGLAYNIGTDVYYAPYVEFGTGKFVEIPEGAEEQAAQAKGAGIREVNLPARPFLFPAAETERPLLEKEIAEILKKVK